MKKQLLIITSRLYRYNLFIISVILVIGYFSFSATSVKNYPQIIPIKSIYKATIPCPELIPTLSEIDEEKNFLNYQGVVIESLDGGLQLAHLNAEHQLNPASGMKVITTLAALDKWGINHRFRTSFYANGQVNRQRQTLEGDLVLYSEGDPTFRISTMRNLAKKLRRIGIRKVTGDLVIDGPFSIDSEYTYSKSVKIAKRRLSRAGIRINGEVTVGKADGTLLLSHLSDKLIDIIWVQNAHSVNAIAERFGEILGGPEAVMLYLIQYVGLDQNDIFITYTSGLDYNRITPNGMLKVLRKLYQWCQKNDVTIDQIMPAAGLDPSTVGRRFSEPEYRGGILAKTGTLLVTDDGVSTLVGFINTKKYGMLVFGLFNSHGDVRTFHGWQNNFLKGIINRAGGIIPFRETPQVEKNIYTAQRIIHHYNPSQQRQSDLMAE